jgi:hypothetical protein
VPDIPFFVPPPIVTVIAPDGTEFHGIEAIRAHMEQIPEVDRYDYRVITKDGLHTYWGQMNDPAPDF